MKYSEIISEIHTLKHDDFKGGVNFLTMGDEKVKYLLEPGNSKPLPGGSGFRYIIETSYYSNGKIIRIIDPLFTKRTKSAIAKLVIVPYPNFPIANAYKVDAITTHEKYRGQNLAKALYGLVLLPPPVGLGGVLLAGLDQTPGGQRNWLSLAKIPGVDVTGYLLIDNRSLGEKALDEILGKMGAVYFGRSGQSIGGAFEKYYFEFPITVGNQKLINLIKTKNFSVYDPVKAITGLMARYLG